MMIRKFGGFNYQAFALRKVWIDDYFFQGIDFFYNNSLGPRQLEAFIIYLRHLELIDKKKSHTPIFELFRKIYDFYGINSEILWSILWVNLCCNSSLFEWWTNISTGKYFREDVLEKICQSYGKSNQYTKNACLELIGTLERTPIGTILGQGVVKKEVNKRIVIKEGNADIPSLAILYSLYRFASLHNLYRFTLEEIANMPLSPQKVFTLKTSKVENLLKSVWQSKFMNIEIENDNIYINLNRKFNHLDLLENYLEEVFGK